MPRTAIRRMPAAAIALTLGVGGALLVASPAAAAPFSVSTLDDDGDGSLRAAITAANAAAGADEIVFEDGLSGTITLESPIQITDALTISGPGVGVLTITHDSTFDLFEVEIPSGDLSVTGLTFLGAEGDTSGRAFDIVEVDGDVTFQAVAFTDFEADGDGGAVRFQSVGGNATLREVRAEGNVASGDGGAFQFGDGDDDVIGGDVVLDLLTAIDNEAGSSGGGANLASVVGKAIVVDSYFADNVAENSYGGGLRFYFVEGGVSVTDTTFDDNVASSEGGGVQFEYAIGTVDFTRATFIGNGSAIGGGIFVYTSEIRPGDGGSFTIRGSRFIGNSAEAGGGIAWNGASDEPPSTAGLQLLVDSSSFWNNEFDVEEGSAAGLSIFIGTLGDGERVRVVNSTFDEHSEFEPSPYTIAADMEAGAVLEVLHSTIVGPGGVIMFDEGAVLVSHTILSMTTDDPALEVWNGEVDVKSDRHAVGPDSVIRGAGPLPSAGGAVRTGAVSLAGPIIPGAPFTLEWSIVSGGVTAGTVAQGPGNQLDTDPELGPLVDNGGETPTMLPATGSPAINTGDPDVTGAPSTDQRGATRVVATIDIGAVETPTPATLPATGGVVDASWLGIAGAVMLLGVALLVLRRVRRVEA